MKLIQELKRRNVFRVAIFYLVSSWVILQVGALLFDIMELPAEWKKMLLVALIIGFPIALVVSWVFEVTPEGVKRESQIDPSDTQRIKSGQRMNIATIVVVLIAIVLLGLDRFSNNSIGTETPTTETLASEPLVPIVAVLPFSASGSDDGGFLAGGLHDDLLTRLARLNAFKVISRTSMMEYAQTTKNMREIGQELGAGYILQGGVQARGQRVRINAQLIDAENDKHLWAETYDRELSAVDLFDIQAELARAIASELSVTLSGDENARINIVPTENIAAYNAYLRALELRDKSGHNTANNLQVIESLKQSVDADPIFAEAWAELSIEYSRIFQSGGNNPKYSEAALEARAKANTLNPDLPQGIIADAVYQYRVLKEYQRALDLLNVVESSEPLTASVLTLKGFIVRRLGNEQQFYQILQQAYQLDPRSVVTARELLDTAVRMNKCDEARLFADAALALAPDSIQIKTSRVLYEMACTGDLAQAAKILDYTNNEYLLPVDFLIASKLLTARADYDGLLFLANKFSDSGFPQLANLFRAQALKGLDQDEQAANLLNEIEQYLYDGGKNDLKIFPHRQAMLKVQLAVLQQNQPELQRLVEEHRLLSKMYHNNDMFQSQYERMLYAEAFASVGLKDKAVEELTNFFALPHAMPFLYIDVQPVFDVLDGHAGFDALRARYATTKPAG